MSAVKELFVTQSAGKYAFFQALFSGRPPFCKVNDQEINLDVIRMRSADFTAKRFDIAGNAWYEPMQKNLPFHMFWASTGSVFKFLDSQSMWECSFADYRVEYSLVEVPDRLDLMLSLGNNSYLSHFAYWEKPMNRRVPFKGKVFFLQPVNEKRRSFWVDGQINHSAASRPYFRAFVDTAYGRGTIQFLGNEERAAVRLYR